MEGLLHGADGDFVESGEVDAWAFGVVCEEDGDFVDADFDGFFDEPFDAVGVFGWSDGDV